MACSGESLCSRSNDDSSSESEYEFSSNPDYNKFEKCVKGNKLKYKEHLKIVLDNSKKSDVWKYCGDLYFKGKVFDNSKTFCKLCLDQDDYVIKKFSKNTSTNSIKSHLSNWHEINFEITGDKTKQQVINQLFNPIRNQINKKTNISQKYSLTRELALICALDFQAFNISEHKGFKLFCSRHNISPQLPLPSSRNIAETGLRELYSFCQKELINMLSKSPNNLTLVLDCWTDNCKRRPFINYRVHFCSNFNINVLTLKTALFPRPHTADRIKENIENTLSEFNLQNKQLIAVTDNGANIIAGLRKANIKRLPCTLHSLHLFITKDILQNDKFKILKDLVDKLKRIFKALTFHHDTLTKINDTENMVNFLNLLDQVTEIDNINDENENISLELSEDDLNYENLVNWNFKESTSLKNSNLTRWSSLYKMLDSFKKNFAAINSALGYTNNHNLLINPMEKSIVTEFCNFLSIFKVCSEVLQGQKFPTLSLNFAFYEKMEKKLMETQQIVSMGIIIELYEFAISNLRNRFSITNDHLAATLLDPVQKDFEELQKYFNADLTKEKLLLLKLEEYGIKHNEILLENVAITNTKENPRLSLLSDFINNNRISNRNTDTDFEIKLYVNTKVNDYVDPIDWWKQNASTFKSLSLLAQFYFSVPASSASSEMAFSTAGGFSIAKRSSLNPAKLNQLCFIHDNFDIIQDKLMETV